MGSCRNPLALAEEVTANELSGFVESLLELQNISQGTITKYHPTTPPPSKGGKQSMNNGSPTPSLDGAEMEGQGRSRRRWRLMSANLRVVSWKML